VTGASRLVSLLGLIAACAACPSGGQQPAPAQRGESFSPLLQPASNPACPAAFPRAYRYVGTKDSDVKELFRIVWTDGVSRGDYVAPVGPDAKDASAARCIAIGPHRDFNITNWCCR
jgi:hypothetical protein